MCHTSRWLLTFGFGRTFFRAGGAGSAGAHRHVGVQEFFVHGGKMHQGRKIRLR